MPDDPVNMGNVGGFARRAIEEGWSQRRFTDTIRESGGDVSRGGARSAYNEAREAMLNAGDARGLPGHRIPGADNFTPWAAGKAGRYAYQINISITDLETGETRQQPWIVPADEPMSINRAQQIAIDQAEAGVTEGLYENERVDGARITGLYIQTGKA